MKTYVSIGAVAAGLLVAAILGAQLIGGGLNVMNPGPTATPEPPPLAFPEGDISTGGRYKVQMTHAQLDVVMRLGAGWTSGGWYVNGPSGAVAFFFPANVNTDACDQEGSLPSSPIGPTVDDFLNALDTQENSEMTAPVDVTIDSIVAKRIELRPSANAPCTVVKWWQEHCCGDPDYRGHEKGDDNPDTVWILDADGQRIAIVGYWDHSLAQNGAVIADIVSSIQFVPR